MSEIQKFQCRNQTNLKAVHEQENIKKPIYQTNIDLSVSLRKSKTNILLKNKREALFNTFYEYMFWNDQD